MGADSSHVEKIFFSQIHNIFWKFYLPTQEKTLEARSQTRLIILRFEDNSLLRDDELDALELKELTEILRI